MDSLTFDLVRICTNFDHNDKPFKDPLKIKVYNHLTNYLERLHPLKGTSISHSSWIDKITPLVMDINSDIAFSLKQGNESTPFKHPYHYHTGYGDKIRPLCDTFFIKHLQLEITDVPPNPFTDKVGTWSCV